MAKYVSIIGLLWLAGSALPALAQEGQEQEEQEQEGQESKYSGVTLQSGDPPVTKEPPPGFQYLTWPGFRANSTGSEVFLQLTGPVTFKTQAKGRTISITLNKVLVLLQNSLRKVITKHFEHTPINEFRLRKLKKDRLRLEIKLRRRVVPHVTTKQLGQFHYLIVTFPSISR